jgi:hypothetical protein
MSEDIRKMIDKVKNFKQFVNENKNDEIKTIESSINLIRSNDFHFWKEDEEVIDLLDKLEMLDLFYDEDKWEVFKKF